MAELRTSQGLTDLLADLLRQASALLAIEFELIRAELTESSARAASGLAKVAVGAVFLLAAVFFVLAALAAFLVRLGAPVDLALLIVAVAVAIGGVLVLRSGARAFQRSNLLPRRSLAQLSSLTRRV